ncbi:MAG: hypothetical protein ACI9HK_003268 [Pirellulaceae bacterium]|jgi:hypothetical protein
MNTIGIVLYARSAMGFLLVKDCVYACIQGTYVDSKEPSTKN